MKTQLCIWHLTRTDTPDYGQNAAHIIIAQTDQDARLIAGRAARSSNGENGIVWIENTTTVQLIGTASADLGDGIVLTEYHGE
jgi:hypothetical protein